MLTKLDRKGRFYKGIIRVYLRGKHDEKTNDNNRTSKKEDRLF